MFSEIIVFVLILPNTPMCTLYSYDCSTNQFQTAFSSFRNVDNYCAAAMSFLCSDRPASGPATSPRTADWGRTDQSDGTQDTHHLLVRTLDYHHHRCQSV